LSVLSGEDAGARFKRDFLGRWFVLVACLACLALDIRPRFEFLMVVGKFDRADAVIDAQDSDSFLKTNVGNDVVQVVRELSIIA
jgi:hypothetical protein